VHPCKIARAAVHGRADRGKTGGAVQIFAREAELVEGAVFLGPDEVKGVILGPHHLNLRMDFEERVQHQSDVSVDALRCDRLLSCCGVAEQVIPTDGEPDPAGSRVHHSLDTFGDGFGKCFHLCED